MVEKNMTDEDTILSVCLPENNITGEIWNIIIIIRQNYEFYLTIKQNTSFQWECASTF